MIILQSTDNLRVTTSTASALDSTCSFVDTTATAVAGDTTRTNIASATTTTVLAAPAAATERVLKYASFCARGGANSIIVLWNDGTTAQQLGGASGVALSAGDSLIYTDTEGWRVHDSTGAIKYAVASGGIQGHVIRSAGVDQTQRAALNFTTTVAAASFPASGFTTADDAGNGETEVTASLGTMPANTIATNPTAGVAAPGTVALAVQQTLIRGAGNIVASTAATAGQVLGRTRAGGNLDFITPPGSLLRAPQVVLASNATFAHAAGTLFAVVEGQAAGGAGGGCAATLGAMGNGGNAGNWGRKTFTISGTSAIVIGAVGAGASAAVGGNAVNSSFTNNAVVLTLPGGLGGAITAGAGTVAIAAANSGNAASTGADIGDVGRLGQRATRNAAVAGTATSGDGGSSPFGSGGFGLAATAAAGEIASGFGAGGGGAVAATAATAAAGGNGSPAFFVVWDFG